MKIRFQNSSLVCNSGEGDTILLACAREGIVLSAPCGGRQRCGKCRVKILAGEVTGDKPDAEGWVRSCMAIPLSDLTIAPTGSGELTVTEVTSPEQVAESRLPPERAGVAIDIGTTTVSARLIDLDTSAVFDTVSQLNDQRAFGADVMSRIGAARKGRTPELFNLINRQTEQILNIFRQKWSLNKIEKLTVSGNTTMLHLFLNIDPSGMGELPFTPVFLDEREVTGASLSLSAGKVIVLPSIAAFIGADITAGITVLDMMNTSGNAGGIAPPSLLVDIGTNGEMALYNKGTIYCCSTAAGPAFEGAEISCGVGGVNGAISRVEIDNTPGTDSGMVSVRTIGNAPPIGVCGSGLIDAVAVMLRRGIISETGLLAVQNGFCLAPNVSISPGDIRQFQLAKSAILSGIRILCKNAGLNTAEVKNVYIAGGFGFFIDRKNAIASGIFPEEFMDRITISGNLSLQGAVECLYENDFIDRCNSIRGKCRIIELASDPAFMDEFAENMLFGEI